MTIIRNELFFVVLPTVHLGGQNLGLTEQILTLMPERSFATRFFDDEVNQYIQMFKIRLPLLTGGHVQSYEFQQEKQDDGRYIVRVVQNVG